MPIPVLMPALSPTMTEGKIAKWLIEPGNVVESGDVIAEIETDKATMEVEAADSGTVGRLEVAAGTEGVAVNKVIALLLAEGEDPSALDEAPSVAAAPTLADASPTPVNGQITDAVATPVNGQVTDAVTAGTAGGGRVFASPLARRIAGQEGVDLGAVMGSGPHGRIVKRDVEAALKAAPAKRAATLRAPETASVAAPSVAAPSVAAEVPSHGMAYAEQPNGSVRKVIARRLGQSFRDVPHFYLSVDCLLDALLALRQTLNDRSPAGEGAYKLSVNDFVVRAVALALRKVPEANASWTDEAIRLYRDVDVSVAVATPAGLITPIVRRADTKGLAALSAEMKDLTARARDGKLRPEEFQGGGFTVSNLGMHGIKQFSAIINPPQSCILAVGAAEPRPVVKGNALAIATVMTVTLSVDHRSVDGVIGARFLAAFKALVEEPVTMML